MPNVKSAIKRTRRTLVEAKVNRIRKSKYRAAIKKMQSYIDKKDQAKAKSFFSKFNSELMKVAKTGVVSKKTASRKISRINKKIINIKKK